ncbi:MAG: DNA primase [Bacteroidota bacterium]|nr:DNA primase [Bacteroidota bacterium]
MRIPEEKIEEIRTAADIVEVVGEVVRLKKSGRYYVGLCPFHHEKTPSFHVNPERNIYKCFGCGRGGNVFSFLMEAERLSFVDAVLSLAERYHIPLRFEKEAAPEGGKERVEALYEAARIAARFFYDTARGPAGSAGAEYLRRRGWSEKTLTRFGIGFAPDSWDALLRHATEHGIPEDILVESGLVVRTDSGRMYDRFRNRIIFPVFSQARKVVGFGARALGAGEEPKYLNSPETPIYVKGRILYGLVQAARAIRQEDAVILVEGYADVLTLSQAGIENVVATSGTALTPEQARLLVRQSRNLYFLYDADSAGFAAMERGIDVLLEQDCDPRIVLLEKGEDPDSYVRQHGAEALRRRLGEAVSFVEFIARKAFVEGDSPERKTAVVRRIVDLLAKMEDPIRRQFYVHHLAEKFGIYESVVFDALEERLRKYGRESARRASATHVAAKEERRPVRASAPRVEREFLSYLFRAAPLIQREALRAVHVEIFDDPRMQALLKHVIEQEEHDGALSVGGLQNKLADDIEMQAVLTDVLLTVDPSPGWVDVQTVNPVDYRSCLIEAARTLYVRQIQRRIERLSALQKASPDDQDLARDIYALRRAAAEVLQVSDFETLQLWEAHLFAE